MWRWPGGWHAIVLTRNRMSRRWGLLLAGLLCVAGLSVSLWLADVLGVSKLYINGFFLVMSIVGYAFIGMFCRTTRPRPGMARSSAPSTLLTSLARTPGAMRSTADCDTPCSST